MSHAKTKKDRLDLHQTITDNIVAAIEAGAGEFRMPWHRAAGSLMRPVNIATGARYQGVNVVTLWIAAESQGYTAPVWGTFKQWLDKGHPVRKGEKAALGVIYKDLPKTEVDEQTGEETSRHIGMARAFWLFNAAQVDGYAPPVEDALVPASIDPIDAADALIAASGARITETGDRAFYRPSTDEIYLPERQRFTGSETMSPSEAFYATGLHELTHWSGAKHRLDRDLSGRFGDDAYAMEELIAELGSAYLCADLGVTPIARPDHAAYLNTWLKVLKADKRAIFTAASQAQRAASFLSGFAAPTPTPGRPEAMSGGDSSPAPTDPDGGPR